MRLVAGIPTINAGLAYVTLSIVGTALFMLAILKLNYNASVVIGALMVFTYVFYGGMVATTWSAAFQGVTMAVAAVVGAIYAVAHFGGINPMTDAILSVTPNFFNAPYVSEKPSSALMGMWTGIVGIYFTWHFGFAAMPYTVVRFFTAQDIKSARRSIF